MMKTDKNEHKNNNYLKILKNFSNKKVRYIQEKIILIKNN